MISQPLLRGSIGLGLIDEISERDISLALFVSRPLNDQHLQHIEQEKKRKDFNKEKIESFRLNSNKEMNRIK